MTKIFIKKQLEFLVPQKRDIIEGKSWQSEFIEADGLRNLRETKKVLCKAELLFLILYSINLTLFIVIL